MFTFLLWNIQMSGQCPNWDSTNVFKWVHFCWKLINLDNFANTANFFLAFLHSEITGSSKLRFLPISTPSNFCFALSPIFLSPIFTQTFSYYAPKLKGNIFNSWVSCYWFQTIQLLKTRCALISWTNCLNHCRKHETLCHLQNCKLP